MRGRVETRHAALDQEAGHRLCAFRRVWPRHGNVRERALVSGFLVERGMTGFDTPRIAGKMSLRASETGRFVLDECRVPKEKSAAGQARLGRPLRCLNEARFGIAWGALGAAKACFDSALSYTGERIIWRTHLG